MSPDAGTDSRAVVHRLHPLRLLVVSDDRGFCGVTSLLLERNGFAVRTTRHGVPLRVVELAREHRTDVVLIDEFPSRRRAARTAAALELLYPRGRHLVVCEQADGAPRGGNRVARSSSVAELKAAVERCYAGGAT